MRRERENRRAILEELVTGDPHPHLDHSDPAVRRLAVAAIARLGPAVVPGLAGMARLDPDENVRAEAVEALGRAGPAAFDAVWACRGDRSPRVVEAVATALGELGAPVAVDWLMQTAGAHEATLVAEAAVAALGSIGEDRAVPWLVEAVRTARPQVRRRAVVALAAFDGPEVEAALGEARLDRNPMVREAAEMLLGRSGPEPAVGDGAP